MVNKRSDSRMDGEFRQNALWQWLDNAELMDRASHRVF